MDDWVGPERRAAPSPLTPDELRDLREVLEQQRRYRWLAGLIRNTAAWIVGVLAALAIMWDWLKGVIQAAVK